MLVIQISRHCSEQILDSERLREREQSQGKRVKFCFVFFLRWSQVMTEEMVLCRLKIVRDSGWGWKFIPPARIGERECSGEWFLRLLWWHHEATLARRSQTSWGDVDCYKWVKVGGCWACGCSICQHQCLELMRAATWEPVQADKERCNMGSFGFVEDQSCRCILNHL